MSKKARDDEVTQQIRVGRDALDEALRESAAATKRVQSSVPPGAPADDEAEETAYEKVADQEQETKP